MCSNETVAAVNIILIEDPKKTEEDGPLTLDVDSYITTIAMDKTKVVSVKVGADALLTGGISIKE